MSNIRIERALIKEFNLWLIRADHLSLTFQQDSLGNGSDQERWWVIDGTRDTGLFGPVLLGVDGVDSPITLSADHNGLTGAALLNVIGSPWDRGSTILPSVNPLSDWGVMASIGRQFNNQDFSYFGFNLPFTPLPISNSSSVIASLLYYIGIDIAENMPSQWLSYTVGTGTLLGTLDDDTLVLESDFDTILSGEGDDTLIGTHNPGVIEKLYGGRGDDTFFWTDGINYYHGGQTDLEYKDDGRDRVNYAGVGTLIILAGEDPVPHLSPNYLALHNGYIDQLYSIEELSWHDESDEVFFGEGVDFANSRLELDFEAETPQTQGDTVDFSNRTSGLLAAPSDNPDVVLIGAATPDGGFTDGGVWNRSLEWLIGSAGDDRIYAGSTLLGAEGHDGNDFLSGRTAPVLTGASPSGYDIELGGGLGDDTIVSGLGRSLASGGEGADTFILASLSDESRITEFVIEGADSADRLLLPFNFLVPDGGPFEGSQLFPILGAISPIIGGATFANLPSNPGPGPQGGFDEPGFFYLVGQVPLDGTWSGSWDGRITITDQVVFNRDGSDLLIHVSGGSEDYSESYLFIEGQEFVFQQMNPDRSSEAVIRIVDFSEGMLGIHFYELGEETPFPFPGGTGTPDPAKIWSTAQFTQAGDTLLQEALGEEPETPHFDQPSDGENEIRDLISGTEQDDELIVIASVQVPGEFNTGADLSGGGGNDQLTGGAGRDTLDGGTGSDILAGGRGDDHYIVDSTGDVIVESAYSGFDSVVASVNFTLPDHVEHLTLTGTATFAQGNSANNLIRGTQNDDTLIGLDGNDRLVGGRGNDTLDGGNGDDLYVYLAGDGDDLIVSGGPDPGIDSLKLVGVATDDVQIFQSSSGPDAIVRLADGSRIVLQDFFSGGSITAVGFDDSTIWDAAAITAAALASGPLLNDAPVAGDDLGLLTDQSELVIPKALIFANDFDRDGDTLSIVAVQSLTPGLTAEITLDGDVRIEALAGLTGFAELGYTVSDGQGGLTMARIGVTFIENGAPVVTGLPLPLQELVPGLEWSFVLPSDLFSDPDGDDLIVTADLADGSALPEWLMFDAEALLFGGTPPVEFEGEFFVRLTASDGLSDVQTTFVLRVGEILQGLTLIGTSVADVLTGGAGSDEFYAGGGNDILFGDDGDDVFVTTGNAGLDTFVGGDGYDLILGEDGDDIIGVKASAVVDENGVTSYVLLSGIEEIDGGEGYDILKFDNTANLIDLSNVAVSGIELIFAGGGPDTVIGSVGDDVISGGGHHDTLFGGEGDDIFVFAGLEGRDRFDGGEGTDTILGSDGDDILFIGGGSADLASIEVIDFGDGFDVLRLYTANDVLDLSAVDVYGLEQIEGGAGADWIRGSSGNETIFGGTRQDTFVFSGFFGQDTIADFQLQLHPRANGDLIDLSDFEFESYLDVLEITHDVGGNSVIQIAETDSSITILNITKSMLQADDFLL